MLRNAITLVGSLLLVATLGTGCSKSKEAPPVPTGEAGAPVAVTAEGSEFDPAVAKDRIPAGAWYCDMGSVHYARAEKGDAVCPLCKMDLVEKPGGAKKDAPEEDAAKEEGAKHEHGKDGEHAGH